MVGPVDNERNSSATFVATVFSSTERARWIVTTRQFPSLVTITIIEHRTVVARDDDERVFVQSLLAQSRHHLSDGFIELLDGFIT